MNWWDELVPPPPPADSARTADLGQIAALRRSLPTPQTPVPGGPSWDPVVAELESALYDPDDARWDRAVMLASAVLRLQAVVAMVESWAAPRSSR